jgi:hypothetical protein
VFFCACECESFWVFFFFLTRKRERKKLVFFWCFSIGFAQVPITKKQFNTRSMDAKKTSGSRIMSWRRRWGEEIGDNIPILRFAELNELSCDAGLV